MDDSSLGVDGRDDRVMERLTNTAQRHKRTLVATGGKLSLQKCTWVMVNWAWVEGEAIMRTSNNEQHTLDKLLLQQSETSEVVDMLRLDPTTAYRTLGAWIAADGNQRSQLEVL